MKYELWSLQRRGSGAIVNIGSGAGLLGVPGHSGYVASKHAGIGLTRSAALEYAAGGIRVNAVAPGLVDTPLIHDDSGELFDYIKPLIANHPIGRIAQPEEIADAVVWLASPKFMTHRTELTTRRRSRPSCPSSGGDSSGRGLPAGRGDQDRRGHYLPRRGVVRGSRRWAIRWAEPSRIGPYQAQRRARTGGNVPADLQVFLRLRRPRMPCFTRERSLVRTQPRPSSKGAAAVARGTHHGGVRVCARRGRASAGARGPFLRASGGADGAGGSIIRRSASAHRPAVGERRPRRAQGLERPPVGRPSRPAPTPP